MYYELHLLLKGNFMLKKIGLVSFFALALVLSESNLLAVVLDGPSANATAQDYIEKYGSVNSALEYALRQGNHNIIADLFEGGASLDLGIARMILALQQLYDLQDLFMALQDKKLSLEELILVLKVFKAQPRPVNEYGEVDEPQRVRDGNNALDFSQLEHELACRVAQILNVKIV